MDNAVALVQAYLRINGYFTVAEYPILETHGKNAVQMATDIDILAFRFPGAIRQVVGKRNEKWQRGLSIPDPDLKVPSGAPDMIIGEVKEGRARLNKSMRNPSIVSAALARFGCCAAKHAEGTAQKLLASGRAKTPEGHMVRIVVFASGGAEERRFQVLTLAHITDFLRSYLREHWQVLHHAQFRDPVLSLLMTLEKAGDAAPVEEDS
ncbi:MAG: hypothetical protein GWN21_06805 [Gammaproteobacteria bacterium]|nr:hypothetical protein [Gammaproteobacteria bacterium]NIP88417.1 hypothetical protein [Gammaproteobacteria bacterium]NIR22853.1 hypothetical protein [Gammaproteobacteria bacterium]NIS04743.1 hypothetical protein [Gammaproteobacteria bacterium]NIU40599.1 hypothetical protein [Gammaproteobacteria bacterium]